MILAILQARMSSTRLPGKIVLPILDTPVLELQIKRILHAHQLSKLIVATSKNSDDDVVEALCHRIGIECYRGDLHDVLDRYYQAARPYQPHHVVRLTGDCPVIDSDIIDAVIQLHLRNAYFYTSNVLPPTFPDGLDVEIFQFSLLEKAWQQAVSSYDREHVTPWIRQAAAAHMGNYESQINYSRLRWTLDEMEDYILIKKIFENLYQKNQYFGYQDVLALMRDIPFLQQLNAKHVISRV